MAELLGAIDTDYRSPKITDDLIQQGAAIKAAETMNLQSQMSARDLGASMQAADTESLIQNRQQQQMLAQQRADVEADYKYNLIDNNLRIQAREDLKMPLVLEGMAGKNWLDQTIAHNNEMQNDLLNATMADQIEEQRHDVNIAHESLLRKRSDREIRERAAQARQQYMPVVSEYKHSINNSPNPSSVKKPFVGDDSALIEEMDVALRDRLASEDMQRQRKAEDVLIMDDTMVEVSMSEDQRAAYSGLETDSDKRDFRRSAKKTIKTLERWRQKSRDGSLEKEFWQIENGEYADADGTLIKTVDENGNLTPAGEQAGYDLIDKKSIAAVSAQGAVTKAKQKEQMDKLWVDVYNKSNAETPEERVAEADAAVSRLFPSLAPQIDPQPAYDKLTGEQQTNVDWAVIAAQGYLKYVTEGDGWNRGGTPNNDAKDIDETGHKVIGGKKTMVIGDSRFELQWPFGDVHPGMGRNLHVDKVSAGYNHHMELINKHIPRGERFSEVPVHPYEMRAIDSTIPDVKRIGYGQGTAGVPAGSFGYVYDESISDPNQRWMVVQLRIEEDWTPAGKTEPEKRIRNLSRDEIHAMNQGQVDPITNMRRPDLSDATYIQGIDMDRRGKPIGKGPIGSTNAVRYNNWANPHQ